MCLGGAGTYSVTHTPTYRLVQMQPREAAAVLTMTGRDRTLCRIVAQDTGVCNYGAAYVDVSFFLDPYRTAHSSFLRSRIF